MTTSMELALITLILWLMAVFDAMSLSPAVETLVVSWRRVSLAFTLLLFIPQEGADVFFSSWPEPYLCRFHLVESFAGAGFLPCSHIHAIRLQVSADFFYGSKCGVVVVRASTHREELVANARVNIVFQIPNGCTIISFGVVFEFHELHNESDHGHVVGLFELL